MNKQFTGFLSSVADPGNLSLTVESFTKALLSAAAMYAVVKGLDASAVTSQVQGIIDTAATGVTAGLTAYHAVMTVWGLVRKLWYMLAKPTVPTAQ